MAARRGDGRAPLGDERAADIIRAKRDGRALSAGEIEFFVRGAASGGIADAPVAAFLMAVYLNGMDAAETAALTSAITRSGVVLDLRDVPGPKVDKHSTGGVGDKTSLVLAPAAAAAGAVVPMISGRSLGHTGGTLDKMESIPGLRTDLTVEGLRRALATCGAAIVGQTAEMCPADRRLYALRDRTATVESTPLIVGSIMGKKLAEGIDALVLDVKTGSGAFMRELPRARELAAAMVAAGRAAGIRVGALVTDMGQPLGRAVGNALEVREALEALAGGGPPDLALLCRELAARMLLLAGLADDLAAARERYDGVIASGAARARFADIVRCQGGDPAVVERPGRLPAARVVREARADRAGAVLAIDTRAVGEAALRLGAGRGTPADAVDPAAGFLLSARVGDRLRAGDPLGAVHGATEAQVAEAAARLAAAFEIGEGDPVPPPLIHEEID